MKKNVHTAGKSRKQKKIMLLLLDKVLFVAKKHFLCYYRFSNHLLRAEAHK